MTQNYSGLTGEEKKQKLQEMEADIVIQRGKIRDLEKDITVIRKRKESRCNAREAEELNDLSEILSNL